MNEQESLGRLMRLAGARPDPHPQIQARARAAVEAEWRLLVLGQRRRRARLRLLAASLAVASIAAGVAGLRHARDGTPVWIGTMLGSRGGLQMTSPRGPSLSASGEALLAGTRIETSTGGAAMFTLGSVALRLAETSSVVLETAHRIDLQRGSLYIDSGRLGGAATALLVQTEFGAVRHRGTQYQVQALPGRYLFVAVREGEVQVTTLNGVAALHPGEGLRVDATRRLVREHLAPDGDAWQWVSNYAPTVSIDGRPLSALLDWYARESGLRLAFVAPATRAEADTTILKGSVSGLSPRQALDAVLATTHFVADFSAPGELQIADARTATLPPDGARPPTREKHH